MEVREEEGSVLGVCLDRGHVSRVGDGVSSLSFSVVSKCVDFQDERSYFLLYYCDICV